MKHLLIGALGLVAVIAIACGGGDKKPTAEPTERPAPRSEATLPRASSTIEIGSPTEEISSGRSGEGIGSLFNSVFSSGLSGGLGGAVPGLGAGDESLKLFLPPDADLPDGFTPTGSFTFSAPAGTSEFGAMDMAMTMAVKGDPTTLGGASPDLSSIEMLMAMVIRPEDLQELGVAFESVEDLDPEDIQEEINGSLAGMQGIEVTRFEVLDASGLGDGGFGMEMTIDMTGFTEIFGALGGQGAPELGAMTMRMYMFGSGDHMGAVMRMAFAETVDGAAEDFGIAEIMAGKLRG